MKFLNIITALCATMTVALPLGDISTGSKDLERRTLSAATKSRPAMQATRISPKTSAKMNNPEAGPRKTGFVANVKYAKTAGTTAYSESRKAGDTRLTALGKGMTAAKASYQQSKSNAQLNKTLQRERVNLVTATPANRDAKVASKAPARPAARPAAKDGSYALNAKSSALVPQKLPAGDSPRLQPEAQRKGSPQS